MGNYVAFKNYTKNFKLFQKNHKKPIFINCKKPTSLLEWYFYMKWVTKVILDTLLFLMRFVLISAKFCENTFYFSVVALPAGVKLSRIHPQLTQASMVNRKYLTKLHTSAYQLDSIKSFDLISTYYGEDEYVFLKPENGMLISSKSSLFYK